MIDMTLIFYRVSFYGKKINKKLKNCFGFHEKLRDTYFSE